MDKHYIRILQNDIMNLCSPCIVDAALTSSYQVKDFTSADTLLSYLTTEWLHSQVINNHPYSDCAADAVRQIFNDGQCFYAEQVTN